MRHRRFLKNISIAFSAQGISLLLSAMLSFVVPKFMGIEEFSYWQLFLFYASFCGFFHFGLNDGVYLIYGGTPYEKLDYRNIGAQFRVGVFVQLAVSIVFVLLVVHGAIDEKRNFICFAIALYMPINNAAFFLGFIFQASNNTKWFSVSIALDKLFFLIAVVILLMLDDGFFEIFVCFYLLSRCIALGYCVFKGRSVVFARPIAINTAVHEAINSARIGIMLTLANVSGLVILGALRFLVEIHWGIEQFGQLSLAITIVNFFLVFVQQVSMVLFPALRQVSSQRRASLYKMMSKALSFLMPIVYIIIFPAVMILKLWLPTYTEAFSFLLLLLPLCVFESRMTMIGVTYYKVLRRERQLLLLNGISAVASICISIFGAYICESVDFMIMGIIFVFIARSIIAEIFITKMLRIRLSPKFHIEVLLISVVYYITIYIHFPLFALFVNFITVSIYALVNRSEIKSLVR